MNKFFSDLSALRLGTEDLEQGAVEILTHVPARKPNRHEFFRAHPDPAYTLSTTVFIDKEERGEAYLVAPSMRAALVGEAKPVLLTPTMTRQGVVAIWPVSLPSADGHRNAWTDTAHEALSLARNAWIRIAPDMALGCYRIYRAEGTIPDPIWPEQTFEELLELAFSGRIIESPDHPIVRRLRGLS